MNNIILHLLFDNTLVNVEMFKERKPLVAFNRLGIVSKFQISLFQKIKLIPCNSYTGIGSLFRLQQLNNVCV